MLDKDCLLKLLKLMILSREKDLRESILLRQGKAHIQVSSSGHEGLMALPFLLRDHDYLFPYYRSGHLILGKGVNLELIAQDFFAKRDSSSGGRSMSAHFGSLEKKIFPSAAPIASHCLPAVGTAWGQQLDQTNSITVCSVGDGATRNGEFYEAICQAFQYKLPIIFIVEDNHYAISTRTESFMPFRLSIFNPDKFQFVDGTNTYEFLQIAQDSIEKTRNGEGPCILWCDIERLESHTAGDDHTLYRSIDELTSLRDPIIQFKEKLITLGYLEEKDFEEIKSLIKTEVKEVYKRIYYKPEPQTDDILSHLYSENTSVLDSGSILESIRDQKLDMVEGINLILDHALKSNDKVIVFGQDIEDPKGGVFGFTKGLSSNYPKRVLNAPIAEASIVGSGIGLAAHGYKPIFEIQFIDFAAPAFNQITCNLSSLRWRSLGRWSCPMIIYAPYGAYLPSGGLWHSQSNDCWWTSIPGLKVVVPSTTSDLVGLFHKAINCEDPCLILIPKHIFRVKHSVTSFHSIEFGKGKIVREGQDITIVCWGNCVELVERACDDISSEKISGEIIDLRSLVPYDINIILSSLKKTRRLMVVQEDIKTSSFGATIICDILTQKNQFDSLYSEPVLISREDIHIPYHSELEFSVLPSVEEIKETLINMVNS